MAGDLFHFFCAIRAQTILFILEATVSFQMWLQLFEQTHSGLNDNWGLGLFFRDFC